MGEFYMKRRSLFILLAVALGLMLSSLAVSAQQPRAVPPNDSFTSATAIKIGKNYQVPDIGAATNQAGEPVAICRENEVIPHSVWFTFNVPVPSTIALSTFGTVLMTPEANSFNTVIAIYEQTSPGVFSWRACSDGANGISAGQLVFNAGSGTTYYIVAGTYSSESLLPESTLKLNTRMLATDLLLPNTSFETPINGTDWKLKNDDDDQIVCSDAMYPAPFGLCAFRFTGTPGITTKLTQTIAFPAFAPRKNALVSNRFYFCVMDTAAIGMAKARFIIFYSDGTSPSIKTVDLTGTVADPACTGRHFALALKSKKVASIKFDLKFGSSAGTLLLDYVSYFYTADQMTRTSGLLPVPQAAN
jgi:hypothetical protein